MNLTTAQLESELDEAYQEIEDLKRSNGMMGRQFAEAFRKRRGKCRMEMRYMCDGLEGCEFGVGSGNHPICIYANPLSGVCECAAAISEEIMYCDLVARFARK